MSERRFHRCIAASVVPAPALGVLLTIAACALLSSACSEIAGVDFGAARLKDEPASQPKPGTATLSCDTSCETLGFACGAQFDPCGRPRDCGACPAGLVCEAGKCTCSKKSCVELGAECGVQADGCGGATDCGKCPNPSDACVDGKCTCQPKSCVAQGAECGNVADGCGGQYACGGCTDAARPNCGGNGTSKCGTTACVPQSCTDQGKNCGTINDGCGNVLDCGGCTSPQSCGGAGVSNVCGCTPTSCLAQGKNCGAIPDGCGGTLDCGPCTAPNTCQGAGVANVCGCTSNGTCDECCGAGTDNCGRPCSRATCCGGGGGCFGIGTPVRMADGSTKPIELVEPGETVASYDRRTGTMVVARVIARLLHGPESSAGGFIVRHTSVGTLRVTPNHPVIIDGVERRAEHLKIGSRVFSPRVRHTPASFDPEVLDLAVRSERVEQLELVPGNGESTYDLKVDGPGTFFAANTLIAQKQLQ